MTIEQALEKHETRLMNIPGVVGVGIGGSETGPVILVMVRDRATAKTQAVPPTIEGFPVKVDVSGEITAF
jgi:glucose-6-phosphate isomerase